jgi:hypothetical protein
LEALATVEKCRAVPGSRLIKLDGFKRHKKHCCWYKRYEYDRDVVEEAKTEDQIFVLRSAYFDLLANKIVELHIKLRILAACKALKRNDIDRNHWMICDFDWMD